MPLASGCLDFPSPHASLARMYMLTQGTSRSPRVLPWIPTLSPPTGALLPECPAPLRVIYHQGWGGRQEEDAGEKNHWEIWFRKDSRRAQADRTRQFPTGAQTRVTFARRETAPLHSALAACRGVTGIADPSDLSSFPCWFFRL